VQTQRPQAAPLPELKYLAPSAGYYRRTPCVFAEPACNNGRNQAIRRPRPGGVRKTDGRTDSPTEHRTTDHQRGRTVSAPSRVVFASARACGPPKTPRRHTAATASLADVGTHPRACAALLSVGGSRARTPRTRNGGAARPRHSAARLSMQVPAQPALLLISETRGPARRRDMCASVGPLLAAWEATGGRTLISAPSGTPGVETAVRREGRPSG